jgi:hypothetical protein
MWPQFDPDNYCIWVWRIRPKQGSLVTIWRCCTFLIWASARPSFLTYVNVPCIKCAQNWLLCFLRNFTLAFFESLFKRLRQGRMFGHFVRKMLEFEINVRILKNYSNLKKLNRSWSCIIVNFRKVEHCQNIFSRIYAAHNVQAVLHTSILGFNTVLSVCQKTRKEMYASSGGVVCVM